MVGRLILSWKVGCGINFGIRVRVRVSPIWGISNNLGLIWIFLQRLNCSE